MSGLGAKDVILSDQATSSLKSLEASSDPHAQSVLRRVTALRDVLLSDCLHGEVVQKHRIPARLREKHRLGNLYVEDLPSFWRLLYTINREKKGRYVFIVEIVDHRTYSRWFRGHS